VIVAHEKADDRHAIALASFLLHSAEAVGSDGAPESVMWALSSLKERMNPSFFLYTRKLDSESFSILNIPLPLSIVADCRQNRQFLHGRVNKNGSGQVTVAYR
jgi:hypothetical protein